MIARSASLALVIFWGLLSDMAWAERTVVLVTAETCPIDQLSMLEVRKAFLGWTIRSQGRVIRAFRVDGDEKLNQIFFQSVVAMSERTYERRLVSQALKFGTPRPRELDSVQRLAAEITANDCAIGYMWGADAEAIPTIKSIRILWQGD